MVIYTKQKHSRNKSNTRKEIILSILFQGLTQYVKFIAVETELYNSLKA